MYNFMPRNAKRFKSVIGGNVITKPLPTKVEVETTSWEELVKAVQSCEEQFKTHHQQFDYYEERTYRWCLSCLRTDLIPSLEKKVLGKAVKLTFEGLADVYGQANIHMVVGGIRIEVFKLFFDTFRKGSISAYIDYALFKTSDVTHSLKFE